MIEGTKTNKMKISNRTDKDYFVLMDNCNPIGVCTSIESARMCLQIIAEENRARKIGGEDIYVYEDSFDGHVLNIRKVPKKKAVR